MILQYRLPFDVPGLGNAGDVVIYYPNTHTLERSVELAAAAVDVFADVIPQLHPVGSHSIPPGAAVALVRALSQPCHGRRHLQLA